MVNIIARPAYLQFLFFLTVLAFIQKGHAGKYNKGVGTHWTYNEDDWPKQCKEGKRQSPIELSPDIAQEKNYTSFIFEQYDKIYPVQTKNNGHSFEIRLHVQAQPTVKGGGLPDVYILDHLHFHWQSEHVIANERYPLELHMVHYANKYQNLAEALKYRDGVTVFSVLFYLSPDSDFQFEPLVEVIDKIQDQVNSIQEMQIKINDFLPRDKAGFYRYDGSLTTPNCTEGLIWTVFTNKLPISRDQVNSFPLLRSEDHQKLKKNYRSLQELNDRKVYLRSSPIVSSANGKNLASVVVVVFVMTIIKNLIH